MKKESPNQQYPDYFKNTLGYQEYSTRQKCLHFNQLTNDKPRHKESKDWNVIGLCTLEESMKIATYCGKVASMKGKFDIRDVKIAYEIYTERWK